MLGINMENFRSVIQLNLNNCPLYYYGDYYQRSEIIKAAKMKGQDLFGAWGVPNTDYSKEESKVPVTVI